MQSRLSYLGNRNVSAHPDSRPKKIAAAAAAVLVLLLAIGVGVWAWNFAQPSDLEPNVVVGPHPSKSAEQIAAERDAKIAEGMIGFSISTNVEFEHPGDPGDFAFENPQGNGKRIKLRLVRDDTSEVLLETGMLEPGTYLGPEVLDVQLAPGTYACTAYVDGFKDDGKHVGQVAAGVRVTVRGD